MPDLGNGSVFSQTDGSNNSGTAPSWSGSAAPSTLDDAGRALQGAVTREWNWRSFTLTAAGTADAKTLTYSVAPAAYYNGQRFSFIANTTNTASCTLNMNSVGAKTIKSALTGSLANLASGDMVAGMFVEVAYNTSNDCFVWVNQMPANYALEGAVTSSGLTMATDKLLGRDTASTGAIEELGVGGGLAIPSANLVLNGPAFFVHKNGTNQTGVTDNTETKITFGTEVFDTNSDFDSATNYRFTPTVAGYYNIIASCYIQGTGIAAGQVSIRKNGTVYAYGSYALNAIGEVTSHVSTLVSMNGSTDYVEAYALGDVSSGTVTFNGGTAATYFCGHFVRGA